MWILDDVLEGDGGVRVWLFVVCGQVGERMVVGFQGI